MYRSTAPDAGIAGFTLIEVLVALSIVAMAVSSIGALIASTARGNRSIEAHLLSVQAARALMTAMPDRDQLVPGTLTGITADQQWRLDVSPLAVERAAKQPKSPWVPQIVVLSVRSPIGAELQITTVRLGRGSGG